MRTRTHYCDNNGKYNQHTCGQNQTHSCYNQRITHTTRFVVKSWGVSLLRKVSHHQSSHERLGLWVCSGCWGLCGLVDWYVWLVLNKLDCSANPCNQRSRNYRNTHAASTNGRYVGLHGIICGSNGCTNTRRVVVT